MQKPRRSTIAENMGAWVYALTNEDQLRWVGPEKGVIALAVAAIVNAFWDGHASSSCFIFLI